MKIHSRFLTTFALALVIPAFGLGQAENVPVAHPVYNFLKRMEVKSAIQKYHDAVLPLSRNQVAEFLTQLQNQHDALTLAEQSYLQRYISEFGHELHDSTLIPNTQIDGWDSRAGSYFSTVAEDRQRYLYAYTDSNLSFFVNGLVDVDGRRITGGILGSTGASFVQFGGRIRGTIFDHLGYFINGTNAQFWGSRQLLQRDRHIGQAYTLGITNTNSFDLVEGYARYDAKIVSAQLGRERVLWGNGFDQKMILSDNVRVFDFVRADVEYKSLKYTFMHAWLLGKRSSLVYTLPSDTSAKFTEPVVADKYFAAHRLEFSFPGVFDIGAQEMVIYSNRSPDLAFLNPITLIESAQRSREERDNVFWAFDIQTRCITGVELSGTILLDDLNFPDLFTNVWSNRWAFQASAFYADPFTVSNTSLIIEYTRVEPYVFSHGRSRENDYGSLGALLGPRIGSNSDSWLVRLDLLPHRNFTLSARVAVERHGENEVDATGRLIRNVGGDFLQPHRDTDPERKIFLDGILVKTQRVQLICTYEIMRQLWLDISVDHEKKTTMGTKESNTTVASRVRFEL